MSAPTPAKNSGSRRRPDPAAHWPPGMSGLDVAERPDGAAQITHEGRRLYTFTLESPGEATPRASPVPRRPRFTWHAVVVDESSSGGTATAETPGDGGRRLRPSRGMKTSTALGRRRWLVRGQHRRPDRAGGPAPRSTRSNGCLHRGIARSAAVDLHAISRTGIRAAIRQPSATPGRIIERRYGAFHPDLHSGAAILIPRPFAAAAMRSSYVTSWPNSAPNRRAVARWTASSVRSSAGSRTAASASTRSLRRASSRSERTARRPRGPRLPPATAL